MRKIFFDHIPKTGGTAVTQAMLPAMGVDPASVPDLRLLGTLRYADLVAEYDALPFIGAHCGFEPGQPFTPDRLHCVLLRDPIERLLSAYAFNRHDVPLDGAADGFVRKAKEVDAAEYLLGAGEGDRGEAVNGYVRHLLPLGWNGEALDLEEQRFECARRGLERFDLVGFQDAMEEFCDGLAAMAGVEDFPKVAVVNRTSRPMRAEDLDAAVVERLRERLKWDYMLYEHGRMLMRRRRRAIAPSPRRESVRPAVVARQTIREADTQVAPTVVRGASIASVSLVSEIFGEGQCLTDGMVFVQVVVMSDRAIDDAAVGISLKSASGRVVFGTNTRLLGHRLDIQPGRSGVAFRYQNRLGLGDYTIDATLHLGAGATEEIIHLARDAGAFRVVGILGERFEGQVKLYPVVQAWGKVAVTQVPETPGLAPYQLLASRGVPLVDFSWKLECQAEIPPLRAADLFGLRVTLHNPTHQNWRSTGLRRVALSYRWRDAEGQIVVADGLRTDLPEDIPAARSRELSMLVGAPERAGRFQLEITPVQEGVAWFCDQGTDPVRIAVEVRE